MCVCVCVPVHGGARGNCTHTIMTLLCTMSSMGQGPLVLCRCALTFVGYGVEGGGSCIRMCVLGTWWEDVECR